MSAPEPAVEAAGLARRYGRRWALVDAGLRVAPGTAFLVAGRNGSGKSTLLRLLCGALRPDAGRARVAGFDVIEARDEVRRHTALLAHEAHTYEALGALENLELAARFLGRSTDREALLGRLGEVGLADRADDPVSTFSAGMRKRLSLARTLMQEAAVVLLDEPYGQLDPPGFSLVDGVLARLRGRGAAVVMSTHLLERGAELCQEGLVLEQGRVLWAGPAAELPARAAARP